MATSYETDVIAWANEQAALLRSGNLSAIDIEHIAEEIEDVGKSEQRELASRMVVLLSHLLKWKFQAGRRGASWQRTITVQRKDIAYELRHTPSLQGLLQDTEWFDLVWSKAVVSAANQTGIDDFPETCPWSEDEILSPRFFPD